MSEKTRKLEHKFSEWAEKNIYPDLNLQKPIPITGKENQRNYGDKKAINIESGQIEYIDEKAASYVHSKTVGELIQNLWQMEPGWLFHLKYCTRLLWGYYSDEEAIAPDIVYWVDFPRYRTYIFEYLKKANSGHLTYTNKEYGLTININPSWESLIANNIAEIVHPKNNQLPLFDGNGFVAKSLF